MSVEFGINDVLQNIEKLGVEKGLDKETLNSFIGKAPEILEQVTVAPAVVPNPVATVIDAVAVPDVITIVAPVTDVVTTAAVNSSFFSRLTTLNGALITVAGITITPKYLLILIAVIMVIFGIYKVYRFYKKNYSPKQESEKAVSQNTSARIQDKEKRETGV